MYIAEKPSITQPMTISARIISSMTIYLFVVKDKILVVIKDGILSIARVHPMIFPKATISMIPAVDTPVFNKMPGSALKSKVR